MSRLSILLDVKCMKMNGEKCLITSQFGKGGVHFISQALVPVLVDAKLICNIHKFILIQQTHILVQSVKHIGERGNSACISQGMIEKVFICLPFLWKLFIMPVYFKDRFVSKGDRWCLIEVSGYFHRNQYRFIQYVSCPGHGV